MPAPDLDLLMTAARAAGAIALRYWKKAPRVWNKPGDQGPVTEADLAVNDMLQDSLRAARPFYGWLSEESPDDPARLSCEYVFIIDPIDGTRGFIDGDSAFSHSLSVARHGRITAAVVYLPAMDRLYAASLQSAATCNGTPLVVSGQAGLDGATLLTPKANLAPDFWRDPPQVTRAFRASMAYRLALVAEGAFDGALSFRPTWEWDIAAGSLIAAKAGAVVSDAAGSPLLFNAQNPLTNGVLAAAPGLHAALLDRMK